MADRPDVAPEVAMAEPAAQESGAGHAARSSGVELAFLGLLGLLVLSFIWQLWSLSAFQGGSIGPGFYPLSLAVLLLALVLVRAIRVVVTMPKRSATLEGGAVAPGGMVIRDQILLVALIVVGVLIGYWSGLFVTVGLFLVAGLLSIERVGLRRALTFAAGALVAVYLIFDFWLGMNVGLKGLF